VKAALSLDVDSLRCYHEIHGLEPAAAGEEDPIYRRALPRFCDLVGEEGLPATLFLIGADAPAHAPEIPAGCEVANHSFAHDYRLTLRSADEIRADLERAHAALLPLAPGGRILGLRAPGYNTCQALLEAACALGYRYDSSLLPSPAYFMARAGAVGLHRLRGRLSRSLVGRWQAFAGPLQPYRCELSRPWRRDSASPLLELPIACEPLTRLPLFGTSWPLLPPRLARLALARALRLGSVNFELHAIDFLDASDVSPALAGLQPGLRVPASRKLEAFRQLARQLRESAQVMTLASLAEAYA